MDEAKLPKQLANQPCGLKSEVMTEMQRNFGSRADRNARTVKTFRGISRLHDSNQHAFVIFSMILGSRWRVP